MSLTIKIFHEYGDPRHFLPLYYINEKNPQIIKKIDSIVFDPLFLIYRSIKYLNVGYLTSNVESLIKSMVKEAHSNSDTIVRVVGMAPLHYFVKYFHKLAIKTINGAMVYFTSWPFWNFEDGLWVHKYPGLRKLWRKFLEEDVQYIVCVNKHGWRELQRYVNKEKLFWIPHSVDTDIFKPVESSNARGKNVIVLYVGRLVRAKGIPELIEVIKLCSKTGLQNIRFWFVGEGPFARVIKELESKYPVRYYGYVPVMHLAKIYSKADILVLPTIGLELFGIVLIEAMSSGIPVISSMSIGPSEIIDDGVNGILIKTPPSLREQFVKELYDSIVMLAQHENLRKKMGFLGRKKAIEYYDIRVNAMKWLGILERINHSL